MSVAVSTIAADAAELLLDEDYDRWDTDFHLESANEAERQAVILKPDVYVVSTEISLVTGAKQSLPSTATCLVDITRNIGPPGLSPRMITLVDRRDMDDCYPNWQGVETDATIEHFMYDERDPLTFWVYPAMEAGAGLVVEAIHGASPTTISAIGDNINLPDIYQDTIKHYMLFRAYSLDAANSQFAADRALKAWNLFVTMLERKDLVERAYSPKLMRNANVNGNQ